jgi:predicted DNA-binding protein (UPF0251 family)
MTEPKKRGPEEHEPSPEYGQLCPGRWPQYRFYDAAAKTKLASDGRTLEAARLFLVEGMRAPQAGEAVGISRQAVHVAVRTLLRADSPKMRCYHCGQTLIPKGMDKAKRKGQNRRPTTTKAAKKGTTKKGQSKNGITASI